MASEKKETKEKSLDKMIAKDLRDMAKEIPGITGVHGMKKEELLSAIKEAKGIKDDEVKKPAEKPSKKTELTVQDIKKKIRELKTQQETALKADDSKMATICRRRISRLKKKTRKAA